MFDRPDPGNRLLLIGHVSEAEGGVVSGHGQHLRSGANAVAHQIIEDHLRADRHGNPDSTEVHRTPVVAGHEVTYAVNVGAEQAKEVPVRDGLSEGQRALIVPLPWPGIRIPDDCGIGGVPVIGAQDGADQDRYPDRTGRLIDLRPGIRVA